jgi:hypothetical protein
MTNEGELIQSVIAEQDAVRKGEKMQALIHYINYLLLHHFEKLIHVLYRVDVDEKKLKELLNEKKDQDAALVISELLIERQLQKAAFKENTTSANSVDDEEKW